MSRLFESKYRDSSLRLPGEQLVPGAPAAERSTRAHVSRASYKNTVVAWRNHMCGRDFPSSGLSSHLPFAYREKNLDNVLQSTTVYANVSKVRSCALRLRVVRGGSSAALRRECLPTRRT